MQYAIGVKDLHLNFAPMAISPPRSVFLLALSHRGASVKMVSGQDDGHLTKREYYVGPADGNLLHFVA
jgi:hypothetical protein